MPLVSKTLPAFLFLSFHVFAATDIYTDSLSKRLNFIFNDETLRKSNVGVAVYSLTKQEFLYERNSNKALSPASAIKVMTALTALKKLGPDFSFKTEIFTNGKKEGSTLKGDLIIKGGGDPSLVTETFFVLASNIARLGIKTISGNIIVDDWTFDQIKWDANRIPTETDRAYNAPVGGLSFNYNTTTLYFRPGPKVGDPVEVVVEPDTGYIKIRNSAKTSKRGGGNALVASREAGNGNDTIVVRGSLGQGVGEQRSYFNITSPVHYAAAAFQYLLGLKGVKIQGTKVIHDKVPPSATLLASLESYPLREIVTLMNKFSNNFIADTLVKTLGRELRGVPGTMEKGLAVLKEESTSIGVNEGGYKLVSGSGLTRENHVSASQFIRMLNSAYLEFDVLPELLSSFPIAGRDGTLRRRMKGTLAFGKLRGKTGTIDGVSSLVGVVQSKGGELLAFSVLMNDNTKTPGSMKPWQNYFGQALAEFNRQAPLSEKPTSLPSVMEENNDRDMGD
jgi:D-alanyl-D-alanine carboxypeptidase/D-alanyl-D-alanine-endopeptidase (penicillin-binding protein 4)